MSSFEEFNGVAIYQNGKIVDLNTGKMLPTYFTTEHMVIIRGEWFSVANLVASCFLPFETGKNYVRFKDTLISDPDITNLELVEEPNEQSIRLTTEKRLEYVSTITKAHEMGEFAVNTPYIQRLQGILNGSVKQGKRAPIYYNEVDLSENKCQQFAPVLEVTDAETGDFVMYGSSKDIANKLNVSTHDCYKAYSSGKPAKQGYYMTAIAMVPKQYINVEVTVYYHMNDYAIKYDAGSYCEICKKYNLHFESLSDLLNYSYDETVTYENFVFKITQKAGN